MSAQDGSFMKRWSSQIIRCMKTVPPSQVPPDCGLYILMLGGLPQYVGFSQNLRIRVGMHANRGVIRFDAVRVRATIESCWEKVLIATLRPPFNINGIAGKRKMPGGPVRVINGNNLEYITVGR